ncbi:MAG: hypothetical protein JWM99_4450 [Verrucomicrobiales bacterium]|nr:hypothetical protein [Verrucomicrobiales bacterium]
MENEFVPFGSRFYQILLFLLLFSRGMDFLSTWIATPNLVLEANPLAKKMGWKFGILLNLVISALFARWPLPAIVIITTSVLVAARNLQSAWLMRSLGESAYRVWMAERLATVDLRLYLLCLFGQTALTAAVGLALMYFSQMRLIPFAIGMGIITYSFAVTVYTLLSVWRLRRRTV